MDPLQAALQDVTVLSGVEGGGGQRNDAVREVQLGDGTVGEGIGRDSLQPLLEEDGGELRAAVKGVGTDGTQTASERNTGQPIAGAERRSSDRGDTVRNFHSQQSVTIIEGTLSDGLEAVGEEHFTQGCTGIEGFVTDFRDGVGQLHAQQCRTAVESACSDGRDTFGDFDLLQDLEPGELAVGHREHAGRPVDFLQTAVDGVFGLVGVDCAGRHFGDAVRENEFPERTEGKGIAANLFNPLLQGDARQGAAVVEGGNSDLPDTGTKYDVSESIAAVESGLADFRNTVGNLQMCQRVTVAESIAVDELQLLRKTDRSQTGAGLERLIPNGLQRLRQGNVLQHGAVDEGAAVNLCDSFRDIDLREGLESGKLALGDGWKAVGPMDLDKVFLERIGSAGRIDGGDIHLGQTVWEDQFPDRTGSKSVVADLEETFREVDGSQR